jgi:hypothetical protein
MFYGAVILTMVFGVLLGGWALLAASLVLGWAYSCQ